MRAGVLKQGRKRFFLKKEAKTFANWRTPKPKLT